MIDEKLLSKAKEDSLLQACIKLGYVPNGCYLNGMVVMGLMNRSEDPCLGCNMDRAICHGRAAEKDYVEKRLEYGDKRHVV